MKKFVVMLLLCLAGLCAANVNPSRIRSGTFWNDTMVPAFSVRTGATAPDLESGFGGDSALYYYAFDGSSQTEYVFFEVQIPHDYVEGTTIYPHVHFSPTTTGTGGVKFALTYQWSSIGGDFGSSHTLPLCYNVTANSQWKHLMCYDTTRTSGVRSTISGTGKGISSILYCKLARPFDDPNDTLAADVAFLGFDIHYETDGFGSKQETSK